MTVEAFFSLYHAITGKRGGESSYAINPRIGASKRVREGLDLRAFCLKDFGLHRAKTQG